MKYDPVVVVALFIVVALNVIAGCSRDTCRFVLLMIKILLEITLRRGGRGLTQEDMEMLKTFPKDPRTARHALNVEPTTTTYACCPRCSFPHPPTDRGKGIMEYPALCQYRRFKSDEPCHAQLTKKGVRNDESIRVPLRPYVMQDFRSFLGGLYSREGIEESILLMQKLQKSNPEVLLDIQDGAAARELKGVDGELFLESKDELRTIWSLSYDGFNPYHNKIAGKSASVGSLAMACLSLPPSLRYDNIFLGGVLPGPKQPTLDQINHIIQLLVDVLKDSYIKGTYIKRTYQHPEGRRSREAIVALVNDLPASRKIMGCAGHSAEKFCSSCELPRSNINNVDWWTWTPATREAQETAAKKWRNASTKPERDRIYWQTGVRWSPLWDLPYWDPTKYVVVDGMHNLLLGLVKHHFREVLGMEIPDAKSEEDEEGEPEQEPTEREMKKVRKVMLTQPTSSQLRRSRIPVLRALCEERGVLDHVWHPSDRPTKKGFISALIVSCNSYDDVL
jgi:hypothetical protein